MLQRGGGSTASAERQFPLEASLFLPHMLIKVMLGLRRFRQRGDVSQRARQEMNVETQRLVQSELNHHISSHMTLLSHKSNTL